MGAIPTAPYEMDPDALKNLADEAKRRNAANGGMIRDGTILQMVEAAERRQAKRNVEMDVATVFQDLAQTRKPGLTSFMQFLSCDNLRSSLDNLSASAAHEKIDPESQDKARQAEAKATSETTPYCQGQLKRYRNTRNNPQSDGTATKPAPMT